MSRQYVFLALAGAAAIYGVKKVVDAHGDAERAGDLARGATQTLQEAQARVDLARSATAAACGVLDQSRVAAWDGGVARFARLFARLRNVDLQGEVFTEVRPSVGSGATLPTVHHLGGGDVTIGGALGAGSGVLVASAGFGATTLFARAATGAPITALSGAAAKSATLAWLGGGPVAMGGAGVAGGKVVVGALALGPALALGGHLVASRSAQALAEAQACTAAAEQTAAALDVAAQMFEGLRAVASQHRAVVDALMARMTPVLDSLEGVLHTAGCDYQRMDEGQRRVVYVALQFTKALKRLVTTPLWDASGQLTDEAHASLAAGHEALAFDGAPA